MKTRSVGMAALFVVLWVLPAGAHPPPGALVDSYPQGWQERTIDVFTSGASWTQIQNIRTAVMTGPGPWNANSANAGGFRFVDRGARVMSSLSCGAQLPNVNGIFWEELDSPGGDVATTGAHDIHTFTNRY